MPYGIAVSFKPSAMVESKNLLFRVRCGSTSIVVEPPPPAADTASEVQPCTLPEAKPKLWTTYFGTCSYSSAGLDIAHSVRDGFRLRAVRDSKAQEYSQGDVIVHEPRLHVDALQPDLQPIELAPARAASSVENQRRHLLGAQQEHEEARGAGLGRRGRSRAGPQEGHR
jgi:hypothetical protein